MSSWVSLLSVSPTIPMHSSFFSYLQVYADTVVAFTSPVVIANVACIPGRARSEAYAVRKIKGLRELVRVLPMGQAEVDCAIEKPGDDFEDSLQYHCAVAGAVRIIVTRNTDDFQTQGIQVLEPQEFIKMDHAGKIT